MNNAIFTAFDDNHFFYFIRLYNSLNENYPNHPNIIVHYEGKNTDRINWLKSRKDIRLFLNTELSVNLTSLHFHKAVPSKLVYFKYLLWTNKYDEYDNILHLDVDTLVLGSLDELLSRDDFFVVYNNIPFKEVRILPDDKKSRGLAGCYLRYHGIKEPEHDDMINAGVFMIPKIGRKKKYLESLVEITNDFKDLLVYADQSALSLWCMKHGIAPSTEYQYNFQTPLFNKFLDSRYKGDLDLGSYFSLKKDILYKIKILHYSGPIKPDCPMFRKWRHMGRYKELFYECFQKYQGVPR